MKELEKTKRISIAAVLTILVVLIAILSFKRPKFLYQETAHDTLEHITSSDNFITIDDITDNMVILDVRGAYEYDKGHLPNAINIGTSDILSDESMELLNNYQDNNKTIAFYGNTPDDTVTPFMLLHQLGFENLKVIAINNSYDHNKLITTPVAIEKSTADIKGFIIESVKKASVKPKPKKVYVAPKKVVAPVKKKKKMPVEGGC